MPTINLDIAIVTPCILPTNRSVECATHIQKIDLETFERRLVTLYFKNTEPAEYLGLIDTITTWFNKRHLVPNVFNLLKCIATGSIQGIIDLPFKPNDCQGGKTQHYNYINGRHIDMILNTIEDIISELDGFLCSTIKSYNFLSKYKYSMSALECYIDEITLSRLCRDVRCKTIPGIYRYWNIITKDASDKDIQQIRSALNKWINDNIDDAKKFDMLLPVDYLSSYSHPIDVLGLPARISNALKRNNINTIGDVIMSKSMIENGKVRNLGVQSRELLFDSISNFIKTKEG